MRVVEVIAMQKIAGKEKPGSTNRQMQGIVGKYANQKGQKKEN
jgi:hypothetical protein